METIQILFQWLFQPTHFVLYMLIGFVCWYIIYGLECALNGGSIGRNPWLMPFVLFYEELGWHLPGGNQRKVEHIRTLIGDCANGSICGKRQSWRYEEIREQNLYEECAKDVLGGPIYFCTMHVVGPLLWPIPLVLIIICVALNGILSLLPIRAY